MEKDYELLEMLAFESFIRRISQIDMPLMLKGSFVTRQYFPNPQDRRPGDLDWVYLEPLEDQDEARKIFDEWLIRVTELETGDGVKYRSFKENKFWRGIDYAMADDFPTINTDLICWVDGEKVDVCIDISFNLEVKSPPVPLLYRPLRGQAFNVPQTAPISLQVSWKIHQTLVRPRFKDMFDLQFLVQHPSFDTENRELCLQALLAECAADNLDMQKLYFFLSYDIAKLFPKDSIAENWRFWRFGKNIPSTLSNRNILDYERASFITDEGKLPTVLQVFLDEFKETMQLAGFGIPMWNNLPEEIRNSGKK